MKYTCLRCGSTFYSIDGKLPSKCIYCGSRFFTNKLDKVDKNTLTTLKVINTGVYKINISNLLKRREEIVVKKSEGSYSIILGMNSRNRYRKM